MVEKIVLDLPNDEAMKLLVEDMKAQGITEEEIFGDMDAKELTNKK